VFRGIQCFLIVALIYTGCAQQGSPLGGPKDEDPPVVVETEPANYSTRFTSDKISISFDEYVVLDNVNQELVVSPPMEEKPEIKLRKKTIIIELMDTLKANTTYTFNFGSSIKDLHEGNKLLNFEYVFSTGDVLDSLSVKGTLKYAADLSAPENPITIMLYSDLRDSVPLTDIPMYIGRSGDEGVFSVNNLRSDVYKVFAIKDGNYNFIFDLPSEEIGFLDSSLIVSAAYFRSILKESGALDSLEQVSDSLNAKPDIPGIATDTTGTFPDSLINKGPDLNAIRIDLMLFTEENETQYITNYTREDPRKIEIIFSRPLSDSFNYRSIDTTLVNETWLLKHSSPNRDSLTLWIRDSLYYQKDTLIIALNYTVKDTSNQYVMTRDTIIFSYRKKVSKQSKQETPEEEKITITTIRKGG